MWWSTAGWVNKLRKNNSMPHFHNQSSAWISCCFKPNFTIWNWMNGLIFRDQLKHRLNFLNFYGKFLAVFFLQTSITILCTMSLSRLRLWMTNQKNGKNFKLNTNVDDKESKQTTLIVRSNDLIIPRCRWAYCKKLKCGAHLSCD